MPFTLSRERLREPDNKQNYVYANRLRLACDHATTDCDRPFRFPLLGMAVATHHLKTAEGAGQGRPRVLFDQVELVL